MLIEINVSSLLHRKIILSDKIINGDKWEVPEETRVIDILGMLNLSNLPVMLILNGRQADKKMFLKDGDCLKIFSAVSGG